MPLHRYTAAASRFWLIICCSKNKVDAEAPWQWHLQKAYAAPASMHMSLCGSIPALQQSFLHTPEAFPTPPALRHCRMATHQPASTFAKLLAIAATSTALPVAFVGVSPASLVLPDTWRLWAQQQAQQQAAGELSMGGFSPHCQGLQQTYSSCAYQHLQQASQQVGMQQHLAL